MALPKADKVIIINRSGMNAKYGAAALPKIDAALVRLVAADKKRGHVTIIVAIDDAAQMKVFGGQAIISAADERGAKAAVDIIDEKISPDYFMLLDGPDVVPHIVLQMVKGLDDDPDKDIPSDLPYACDGAFSRSASAYLAVTRVVGRLPMPIGASDAAPLIKLIEHSVAHAARPRDAYASYFAISAETWQQSTQLSLSELFQNHTGLKLSPDDAHPGIDHDLVGLVHFINCHGSNSDPYFYGQREKDLPIAMDSALVAPQVQIGTIAAVECCFGAELYDPALAGAGPPMCMSYLHGGALAYVGSTNIAYGPAADTGQADLITRYFLECALAGASTGRAMLQARQRFIEDEEMSTATNLKTLAQFVLFGDPSLVAVDIPVAPAVAEAAARNQASADPDRRSRRQFRRMTAKSNGMALAGAAAFPGALEASDSPIAKRVRAIAKTRGFSAEPKVYAVTGGAKFRAAAKALKREQKVAVICERRAGGNKTESGVTLPSIHVLVAHILGNGIVAVEECESR